MHEDWRNILTNREKDSVYTEIMQKSSDKNMQSYGNGALLRVAPLALKYYKQPEALRKHAIDDTMLTHPKDEVCLASAIFATSLAFYLGIEEDPVLNHLQTFEVDSNRSK